MTCDRIKGQLVLVCGVVVVFSTNWWVSNCLKAEARQVMMVQWLHGNIQFICRYSIQLLIHCRYAGSMEHNIEPPDCSCMSVLPTIWH